MDLVYLAKRTHKMTQPEAEAYFEKLTAAEAHRFNLLTSIALRLGKPTEGAYEYAKTIMEAENESNEDSKSTSEASKASSTSTH